GAAGFDDDCAAGLRTVDGEQSSVDVGGARVGVVAREQKRADAVLGQAASCDVLANRSAELARARVRDGDGARAVERGRTSQRQIEAAGDGEVAQQEAVGSR